MTRRAIQPLPPDLVNRIAAGEVIERPASVVKELVENALDAGATRLIVEIENGGTTLIRVIDDGGGIPAEELPLAFAQHATSKVRSDEELAAVATMGFRGEALASIGSVSRSRILSRCGEGLAHEVRNDGGRLSEVKAAAGNAGTTVEVRDLFFNVPARRKFLKSASAESAQVTEMLTRLALPRPDVHFRYVRDGKTVWDWPATDSLDRLRAAWPAEYHEGAMPLDVTDEAGEEAWRLEGIVGLPEFAATTGRYQHLYVNGRAVRDRSAAHALREAYRGLTEPGRHPAAVLLLSVPAGEVDVNVHPTKAEVRFRHPSRLWGLIHSAVREVLLGSDLVPKARPSADVPRFEGRREDVRETLASFFKDALGQEQQRLNLGAASPSSEDRSEPSWGDSASDSPSTPTPNAERSEASDLPGVRGVGGSDDPGLRSAQPLSSGGARSEEVLGTTPTSSSPPTTTRTTPPPASNSQRPASNVLSTRAIQLHNSYLVVQSDDGMEIIDQHALHERILFEELLTRLRRGRLESQRMLLPATFEAPESQVALLEELGPTLQTLGIEAEPFGPGTVAVQAFPSFLTKLDPATFVREVLEKAEADLRNAAGNDEAILHEVLDMMACKAAVKAGDPLSPAEVEALISRRDLTSRASNCPHGRPTTLKLSLGDLEKQFKRTGF